MKLLISICTFLNIYIHTYIDFYISRHIRLRVCIHTFKTILNNTALKEIISLRKAQLASEGLRENVFQIGQAQVLHNNVHLV